MADATNSTPGATPSNGTVVDPAELMMSDNFMNEIMGNLAPGNKIEVPRIESPVSPVKQVEPTEPIDPIVTNEPETPIEPENPTEPETPKEPEKPSIQDEILEKRFKDSQSMIGRQANELGQLRKQVAEMQAMMEANRKQEGIDSTPYYEKLLSNSPEVLAQQLGVSQEQVQTLQLAARMAKDIAKDASKPFEQMAAETKQQKEIAQKDAAWYSDHPDYKNRQPVMAKFLNKIYPNGPAAHGADPWQAAHLAYEHAGEVMASVQNTVTQQNDKRIVNARSADGATRGIDASAALKPQTKPVDAKQSAIDAAFQAQAGLLLRGRG